MITLGFARNRKSPEEPVNAALELFGKLLDEMEELTADL